MSQQDESKKTVIEATPDGPYVVRNPPTLKNSKDEVRILTEERNKKITDILEGQKVTAGVTGRDGESLVKKGQAISRSNAAPDQGQQDQSQEGQWNSR